MNIVDRIKRAILPSLYKEIEIIPADKINKMSRDSIILELIRSNRRHNIFYNKTIRHIKNKRLLEIFLTITFAIICILFYNLHNQFIKIGDVIEIALISMYNIYWCIYVLMLKKKSDSENIIFTDKTSNLRDELRKKIKFEWNYMDNQNINKAMTQATARTLIITIIIFCITNVVVAEIRHTTLNEHLKNLYFIPCEHITINSLGIKFNSCDLFGIHPIFFFIVFYCIHLLSVLLTDVPTSGKFFQVENSKSNFISSIYLDNITLSSVNPNQNEA